MLSGEYAVLNGALALSLPCKYGQSLEVYSLSSSQEIKWESYDEKNQKWFWIRFDLELNILENSSDLMALNLQKILKCAFEMSSIVPGPKLIKTFLDFNRNWGLGSSSTLIHLISQWLDIDAMELFFKVANGSGYDIAAAGSSKPIIYQLQKSKANWHEVEIPKAIFSNCYFIHLNQKQKSDLEVEKYKIENSISDHQLEKISSFTKEILSLQSEEQLQDWIENHEVLVSDVLQKKRIQNQLFPDFQGQIKSLGAWGGDFILASGKNVEDYFKSKGFPTLIPFNEMII